MKFNHRLSSIWVFVVDIEIKCTVFHELLYTRNVGAEFVYGFFSISKWSDASKTGCRVKGKGGNSGKKIDRKKKRKKKKHHSKMMENLRNIPTEVSGRAIRDLHGGGSAVSTQRDLSWKSYSLSSFFGGLVFIVFRWCCGHNRWKNKKIRDENHHGQQHRGLSLMVISTIQWHWQFSVSSVRAYYYSPFACYTIFSKIQTCFFTFSFFLEINNWPTLLLSFFF